MSKLTKNQKSVAEKVELGKAYTLTEASKLVKEITTTKFDASVDVDIRLGVDPRKANQMVRGVVTLPNGTGKQTRVLCLCTPDQEAAAKEAGADYVGLDEYIQKINSGWTDVDVIITMPSCMGKVGPLGRVLGPRGLMPNPKSGTVTMDVAKAVKEVKSGKIDFKVDKAGIIHTSIGKISMTAVIKANIPTRIAFQVSSKIDSRTILDQMGAENLLGQGDMLFLPPGTGYPQRVHGAFASDDEVHRIVEYLKQFGEPDYIDDILMSGTTDDLPGISRSSDSEVDPMYDEAVSVVLKTRKASISGIQRQLRIGYNRAARLIDQMEADGIVSPAETNGNRTVLAQSSEHLD